MVSDVLAGLPQAHPVERPAQRDPLIQGGEHALAELATQRKAGRAAGTRTSRASPSRSWSTSAALRAARPTNELRRGPIPRSCRARRSRRRAGRSPAGSASRGRTCGGTAERSNPYLEAHFKTLKSGQSPRPVRRYRAGPRLLPRLLPLVQPRAPPLRDRPDDSRRRPPRRGAAAARRPRPRGRLRTQPRTVRPPGARPTGASDRPVDQQAQHEGRSLTKFEKRPSHST
jgi:hypothetical protein